MSTIINSLSATTRCEWGPPERKDQKEFIKDGQNKSEGKILE